MTARPTWEPDTRTTGHTCRFGTNLASDYDPSTRTVVLWCGVCLATRTVTLDQYTQHRSAKGLTPFEWATVHARDDEHKRRVGR